MKTRKEILKLRDNSLLYNNIRQKSFQSFRFNDKMDKIPSKNKKIHIFSRFQLYSRVYVRVWTLRSWILLVNLKVIISLYITICHTSWTVVLMWIPHTRGTQRRFPPKYIENFNVIQSSFRSLVMHSIERCYEICICSVILGELESFRNYKGFSIIFPKILDAI